MAAYMFHPCILSDLISANLSEFNHFPGKRNKKAQVETGGNDRLSTNKNGHWIARILATANNLGVTDAQGGINGTWWMITALSLTIGLM